MKKKAVKFLIFLSAVLFLAFIFYQFFGWDLAVRHHQNRIKQLLEQRPSEVFGTGEKIALTLRYMGWPAGKIILRVEGMEDYNQHRVYVLSGRLRTSDFMSLFFEAEGLVCSYMDAEKLHSLYFEEESQASGHRKNKKIIRFNQEELFLEIDGEKEKLKILSDTQDPLSAFYFSRLIDIKALEKGYEFNIKSRKRDRTLTAKLAGREVLSTPFGRLKTLKVALHLNPVKATARHEINGFVWFTDDERRLPVLVKLKTKAGLASLLLYDLEL